MQYSFCQLISEDSFVSAKRGSELEIKKERKIRIGVQPLFLKVLFSY